MKRITQSIDYEGPNSSQIRTDLQAWHHQHPLLDNGIDWEFQYMYATMSDQDAFAFTLKHPEYATRFIDV
jgi:hypothetical protein